MRRLIVVSLIFFIGALIGLLLSQIMPLQVSIQGVVITIGIIIISLIVPMLSKKKIPDYESLSRKIFKEINQDVQAIQKLISDVEQDELRGQLELICEDTVVLLDKIAEKMPEARLSTGQFIRGNLDFIVQNILPQYIEMQETPRYFETPEKTMAEGRKAIDTYARFLHRQIANFEIADEMRYMIAIEMLKTLDSYTGSEG